MYKRFILSFFLFSNLILLGIDVKVGIYNNPPQIFIESGKPVGLYVEIVEKIAKQNNWKINYVHADFATLLNMAQSGEIDLLTSIAYTEERAQILAFNQHAVLLNWGVLCSRQVINSLLQLDEKIVATVRKDVYASELRKTVNNFHLNVTWIEVSDYDEVLQQVTEGNADAGVVSRIFAISNAHKYNLKIGTVVFSPFELRFALPKNSEKTPILIRQIDEYLVQLKSDEKAYNELLGRYLGTVFEKKIIPKWLFWLLIALAAIGLMLAITNRILEILVRRRTKQLREALEEVKKTNEQLTIANAEIEARSEEIKALNEELQAQAQELSAMNEELQRLLNQLENGLERFTESLQKLTDVVYCDDAEVANKINEVTKLVLERSDLKLVKVQDKEQIAINNLSLTDPNSKQTFQLLENLALVTSNNQSLRPNEIRFLEILSRILGILMEIRKYLTQKEIFNEKLISVLLSSLSLHESHTAEHSERLSELSKKVAIKLGLEDERVELVRWAAIVHDIGKLAVDKEILNKPSSLSPEEYEKVKIHPLVSAQLLEIGGLREIAKIVKYHHERYDGKGYPEGLKGEEIPIESRIICVIDAFDAMTSDRPYRRALSIEAAIEELKRNSGSQFDPKVVQAFLEVISEEGYSPGG